jgi:hypothetical protein
MINKALKIIMIWLLMVGSVPNAGAEDTQTGEYRVKAAFLYNFAKFVEWPARAFPNSRSPISLCILGKDPFGDALDTIRGKIVKGRKLVIMHAMRVEDLGKCHMVFICSSEEESMSHILNFIKYPNVLTIGDMDNFARHGGIINLVKKGKKIKFEINVEAAQETGLKISSKLLKLARIVSSDQGKEVR